jgi:hypothetical protein
MEQELIFNAVVRRRYSLLLVVAIFGSAAVPFVVGVALIQTLWRDAEGMGPPLTVVGALALAALGPWYIQNRLGLAGNRSLRARLWQRMREQAEQAPEGVEPVFVGFAPGPTLKIWDGDTDQDIGFLAAWGDTLVYFGDRYSWHLPRERIDSIEPIRPAAGLRRIVISWHAARQSNRAFTLVSREARDIRSAERATGELLNELFAWAARPPDTAVKPPALGMPPTDASGGVPLDATPGGSCAAVIAVAVITVLAAWQVALPLTEAGEYYLAILWAGGISILGATTVNIVLRLLQWAETTDRASGT